MAEEQLVVFSLGKEEYGVPVGMVKGIIKYSGATELPNTRDHIEGIINLRENLIPIIELAKCFGLAIRAKTDRLVVIVEVAGREFGIVVDAVTEVIRLQESAIEPAPVMLTSTGYIRGIGKEKDRLLILLNLEPLFAKDMLETGHAGHVA